MSIPIRIHLSHIASYDSSLYIDTHGSSEMFKQHACDIRPVAQTLADAQCLKPMDWDAFNVASIRELPQVEEPPPPAWLADDALTHVFSKNVDHLSLEDNHRVQWARFLKSVLSAEWSPHAQWVPTHGQYGYPALDPKYRYRRNATPYGLSAEYGPQLKNQDIDPYAYVRYIQSHVPIFMQNHGRSIQNFVFSIQTHPYFLIALYEYWVYLRQTPLWMQSSTSWTDINDGQEPEHHEQSLSMMLGANAAMERYLWWAGINKVFQGGTRNASIVMEHLKTGLAIGGPPDFTRHIQPPPQFKLLCTP